MFRWVQLLNRPKAGRKEEIMEIEEIAHYNTEKEAKEALGEAFGYIIPKAFGGYIISGHKIDCSCGSCPVLSTIGTWI